MRLEKEDQDRIEYRSCRGRARCMSNDDIWLHGDVPSPGDVGNDDCLNRISSAAADRVPPIFLQSSQIVPFWQ